MCVECIAGKIGEMFDILQRHLTGGGDQLITDAKLRQRFSEWMLAVRLGLSTGNPAAGDR